MLGLVLRVGRTDGTKWAGPVNGIIDQESDMEIGGGGGGSGQDG